MDGKDGMSGGTLRAVGQGEGVWQHGERAGWLTGREELYTDMVLGIRDVYADTRS